MSIRVLALFLALVLLPVSALAEGALRALDPQGNPLGNLPLVHTDVRMDVSDGVAGVSVTQRFRNGHPRAIEAVYVFPLPVDAAIDAMSMRLGDRVIRAQIARRDEARRTYDSARAQGHRAALLEQERPNIFTMRVANVTAGVDIEVTTHFFGRARYDHGAWELAFPMVVGPRYIPGDALSVASRDTAQVPDASRITPAYVPPGTRSGHAITLTANLNAGGALRELSSPSHELEVTRVDPSRATISLRDKDEIPNRDFVLRWRTAEAQLAARAMMHRPDPSAPGYLSLTLEAPATVPNTEVAPRELVFLLDTSGSMHGAPLDAAKRAVRQALLSMGPRDTFTVIDFADTASSLSPRPLDNTPAHVARALAYLDALRSSGGTNQLAGIHAALALPGDAMRLRYVVFMTDGYIGNERQVMALTNREIGRARIFSFGIGASVNRYLLDEVAHAGRGFAEYLRPDEEPAAMIERFYARVGQPWLTDITVDWGDGVRDALPSPMPDLSALQPLTALARFTAAGPRTVTLRGRVAGREFSREVSLVLPAREEANPAVASVWARETLAKMERDAHFSEAPESTREEVTALALAHHLVSTRTSFVAVDSAQRVSDGAPRTVHQPLDGPEGVNLQAAGGQIGNSFGYGGLGLRGAGVGGGGVGAGTIGLGRLGSVGHGSGVGQGYGSGSGRLRERSAMPTVRAATPTVMGALHPEVVRRVVRRNIGALRRCYELAVARDPSIAGRLAPSFAIGPDGRVVAVTFGPGTLRDPAMTACVATMIRRWVFPTSSGSVVMVSYPLLFGLDVR